MAFFETAVGGTVLDLGSSLLSGIFGSSSRKKAEARAHVANQNRFVYLREAAEKGGFNPLTALMSGYGSQGGGGYSTPPLASSTALQGAMASVSDLLTGRTAQRMAEDKKRAELLELEVNALKAGSQFMQDPATFRARATSPGQGASGSVGGGRGGFNGPIPSGRAATMAAVASDREQQDMPVSSGPGLTVIQNDLLGPEGLVVPGADGEPWGVDEVATAVIAGIPQLMHRTRQPSPEQAEYLARAARLSIQQLDEEAAHYRSLTPKFVTRFDPTRRDAYQSVYQLGR